MAPRTPSSVHVVTPVLAAALWAPAAFTKLKHVRIIPINHKPGLGSMLQWCKAALSKQQQLENTCYRTCTISQKPWVWPGHLPWAPLRESNTPPASQEGEELRNIPAPTQTPWPIAQSRHTTEGAQLVSRMSVWNWLVSQLNQFWFLPVKWTSLLRWNQRRINMEHPEDISIHNIPLSFSVSASLRKLQWNLFKHTQHKNNEVIAVCKEVGCN